MQTSGKDLAIDLGQDRPGQLDGYCDTADGLLHVTTSDPSGTRRAVEGAGFKVKQERDVVIADAQDKPGTVAKIFRQIADAEVNVDLSYSLASSRVVIGSKDFAKLTQALHVMEPTAARR
jgi:hypothetical protein